MKTKFLFLMMFVASYSFSQSVNDYKAVIIPMKYELQNSENQYRLQTNTKFNLQKAGFQAFYVNEEIPAEFNDKCSLLYLDVIRDKAFLVTKLFITFKDCNNKLIFQSEVGRSREKEYEVGYTQALIDAFKSVNALEYSYNGGSNNSSVTSGNTPQKYTPSATSTVAVSVAPAAAPTSSTNSGVSSNVDMLYAQPTSYGYQLVNNEPKVIMKVYKTSNPASYMATKGAVQGALVAKENQWFFEYYKDDKLVSEKIMVKF